MNDQELFDTVARHLLTQNAVSSIKTSSPSFPRTCLYRGPNGTKCAAGVLIKDEFYKDELEGNSTDASKVRYALELSGAPLHKTQFGLMRSLQRIHDGEYGTLQSDATDEEIIAEWPKHLRNLAAQLCLSSAVVDELRPAANG